MSKHSARPVALVTGGAKRIGKQIAQTLAAHGWNIALHYRSSGEEAEAALQSLDTLGGDHHLLQADLADASQVRRLFEEACSALGKVDAVINNAAVFEFDDAASFNVAHLQMHMMPNLAAPLLLAQTLHKHVLQRGGDARGVVVNLLDQKLGNLNPDFLSYTLSKSALKTATTMLAQAFAPQVRVVGVSPGLTLPSHLQTVEAFEKAHRMAPLQHSSSPEDIARSVLFLLESPSITGVDLPVDGGQHLVGMERDFSMLP